MGVTGLAALAPRGIGAPKDDLRELRFRQIDTLDATITEIDRKVDLHVERFRGLIDPLTSIPRVSDRSAMVIPHRHLSHAHQ